MATLADLNRHAHAYADATYFNADDPRRDNPAEVERITHESNRQARRLADDFITAGITGAVGESKDRLQAALESGDPARIREAAEWSVRELQRLIGSRAIGPITKAGRVAGLLALR
jgi:hypothetical protein